MSPRAACRLETMGFGEVYDYVAGKQDWLAAGLPSEGEAADEPLTGDAARRDVPTTRLGERSGEVHDRVRAAGWDQAVVVTEDGVILGRVRGDAFGTDPDLPVEEVMEPGPTTTRAGNALDTYVEHLHHVGVTEVLVSRPDGRLIGVLFRNGAERLLAEGR